MLTKFYKLSEPKLSFKVRVIFDIFLCVTNFMSSLLQKSLTVLDNLVADKKAGIVSMRNFGSKVKELETTVEEFTTLKNIENGWSGKT